MANYTGFFCAAFYNRPAILTALRIYCALATHAAMEVSVVGQYLIQRRGLGFVIGVGVLDVGFEEMRLSSMDVGGYAHFLKIAVQISRFCCILTG